MFLLYFAPRLSELVFWRERKILFQGGGTIPVAQMIPTFTIMMITDQSLIRDAWLVLVVVAVSQSIPGTWGAMMVVVLQVLP